MHPWVGLPLSKAGRRVFYRGVQLPTQLCRTQDFLLLAEHGEHRMRLGMCVALWEEPGYGNRPREQWLRILRYRYRDELSVTDTSAADALMKLAAANSVEVVRTEETEDYLVDQIVGKAAVIHAPNIQDLRAMAVPEQPTYICHYQLNHGTGKLEPVQSDAATARAQPKRKAIEPAAEHDTEPASPFKRINACTSPSADVSRHLIASMTPHERTLSEDAQAVTSSRPSTPPEQAGSDEEKRSTPTEGTSSMIRRCAMSWSRMVSEMKNAPSRKRPRRTPGCDPADDNILPSPAAVHG